MTARLAGLLACCLGMTAVPACALQITGLSALEPVAADRVTASVADGTLHIALSSQQTLTVAPWPAYLPQRFDAQSISATRLPHPAGPIDRLTFRHGAGKPAWLEIGAGAQPSMAIVGPWRLQLSPRGWSVGHGKQHILLGATPHSAQPAAVWADGARWCIYLLDAQIAQPRAGVATEQETRAAWVALRRDARQKRCPVPRVPR